FHWLLLPVLQNLESICCALRAPENPAAAADLALPGRWLRPKWGARRRRLGGVLLPAADPALLGRRLRALGGGAEGAAGGSFTSRGRCRCRGSESPSPARGTIPACRRRSCARP